MVASGALFVRNQIDAMITRWWQQDIDDGGIEAGGDFLPHRRVGHLVAGKLLDRKVIEWHVRVVGAQFEVQAGMTGGNQIVIDVPTGTSHMAVRTHSGPGQEAFGVPKSQFDLLLRGPLCPVSPFVRLQPFFGRSVTGFATDAVVNGEAVSLGQV